MKIVKVMTGDEFADLVYKNSERKRLELSSMLEQRRVHKYYSMIYDTYIFFQLDKVESYNDAIKEIRKKELTTAFNGSGNNQHVISGETKDDLTKTHTS